MLVPDSVLAKRKFRCPDKESWFPSLSTGSSVSRCKQLTQLLDLRENSKYCDVLNVLFESCGGDTAGLKVDEERD